MGPKVFVPIWSISPHRLRRKWLRHSLPALRPPRSCAVRPAAILGIAHEGAEPQAGLGAGAGIGAPSQAAKTPSHTILNELAGYWVCKTRSTAHREPCTSLSMEPSRSDFEVLGTDISSEASAACCKDWKGVWLTSKAQEGGHGGARLGVDIAELQARAPVNAAGCSTVDESKQVECMLDPVECYTLPPSSGRRRSQCCRWNSV